MQTATSSASAKDEELRDFAENAMNELLAWYGYERSGPAPENLSNQQRSGLARWPLNIPHQKTKENDQDSDSTSTAVKSERRDSIAMSYHSCKANVGEDWSSWSLESTQNGDLSHRRDGSGSITSADSDDGKSCGRMESMEHSTPYKNLKKICSWCKQSPPDARLTDTVDGMSQLDFCSDLCLNQFKMNLFCIETQQHLPQMQKADGSVVESTGSADLKILITPDLWLAENRKRKWRKNYQSDCKMSYSDVFKNNDATGKTSDVVSGKNDASINNEEDIMLDDQKIEVSEKDIRSSSVDMTNCWRTTEASTGQFETGAGRHETGAGRHETGAGRHETGAGKHHEIGAGRHETGAGKHETGAGRHETGAGRHETGAGRHERVDTIAGRLGMKYSQSSSPPDMEERRQKKLKLSNMREASSAAGISPEPVRLVSASPGKRETPDRKMRTRHSIIPPNSRNFPSLSLNEAVSVPSSSHLPAASSHFVPGLSNVQTLFSKSSADVPAGLSETAGRLDSRDLMGNSSAHVFPNHLFAPPLPGASMYPQLGNSLAHLLGPSFNPGMWPGSERFGANSTIPPYGLPSMFPIPGMPTLPDLPIPQPHHNPLTNLLPPNTLMVPYPFLLPLPIPIPIPFPVPMDAFKKMKENGDKAGVSGAAVNATNVDSQEANADKKVSEEVKLKQLSESHKDNCEPPEVTTKLLLPSRCSSRDLSRDPSLLRDLSRDSSRDPTRDTSCDRVTIENCSDNSNSDFSHLSYGHVIDFSIAKNSRSRTTSSSALSPVPCATVIKREPEDPVPAATTPAAGHLHAGLSSTAQQSTPVLPYSARRNLILDAPSVERNEKNPVSTVRLRYNDGSNPSRKFGYNCKRRCQSVHIKTK